jgi:hypothetical protein
MEGHGMSEPVNGAQHIDPLENEYQMAFSAIYNQSPGSKELKKQPPSKPSFRKVFQNLHRINSILILKSKIGAFRAYVRVRADVEVLSKQGSSGASEDDKKRNVALLICDYALISAEKELEDYNYRNACALYHLAMRNLLRWTSNANQSANPNYLKELAAATLVECREKLERWKVDKVEKRLMENGQIKADISLEDIIEAKIMIDDHDECVTFWSDSIQWQIFILGSVAFISTLLILIFLGFFSINLSFNNIAFVSSICLFGALGGCVSSIFSFSKISIKIGEELPVLVLNAWLTMARPLVGAVSALVLSTFIISGLVDLGTVSPYMLLAVSFAAGFSERLIVGAVDRSGK